MSDLKNKRILVTGGHGRIGAVVTAVLRRDGAVVIPVGRRDGYDLRNEAETLAVFLLTTPDIVVHLATPSAIRPGAAFKDVVQMGVGVIHAAAVSKAALVVVADPEFGDDADPVGAAKSTLHQMCRFYRQEHGLRSSTLVLPRVYGVGEQPFGFLYEWAQRMVQVDTGTLKLPFHPQNEIKIIHALDAARAILQSCRKGLDATDPVWVSAPTLLFGSVFEKISSAIGFRGSLEWLGKKLEPPLTCDVEGGEDLSAMKVLGFNPEIDIDGGVSETMEFFSRPPAEVER